MEGNLDPWLAIFGMAVLTYATRVGGIIVTERIKPGRKVEAFLKAVPVAVLVSIVAPAVLAAGPAEMMAGAAVLAVTVYTRNLLLGIVVGVSLVYVLRSVL
jgi:uncharacterized membrane protein